jgi:DNA/RNA endonuclease G (NUC1)
MNSIRPKIYGLFAAVIILLEAVYSQTNDTVTFYHKYYSITFSKSKHFPVVVKYWLTKAMLDCEHRYKRSNKFKLDPLISDFTNLDNDYRHSGFDLPPNYVPMIS